MCSMIRTVWPGYATEVSAIRAAVRGLPRRNCRGGSRHTFTMAASRAREGNQQEGGKAGRARGRGRERNFCFGGPKQKLFSSREQKGRRRWSRRQREPPKTFPPSRLPVVSFLRAVW